MNEIPERIPLSGGWEGEIYQKWNFPLEVIERWRSLALRQGDIGLFVSDGWFEAWWNAFGATGRLLVLVLKKGGETKAIFPCRIKSAPGGVGKDEIGSLTNDHTCHYDFIVDPEFREEALSQFVGALHRILSAGQVTFESMPSSGENLVSFIRALHRDRTPVHVEQSPAAPWLEVSGDWSIFCGQLSSRLKNTLKKARKKAEEKGKLRFEIIRQSAELDQTLDLLFEIEYNSWKGKNGTAIRCQPEVEAFYRQLAHWAMRQGCLILYLLKLDETPMSAYYCLSSGNTVFGIKAGYNEAFERLAPGNLLFLEMFKNLFEDPQIRIFNFLGGADRWKMEWASQTAAQAWLKVYPRTVGGWTHYMAQYGWKDLLKKSDLFGRFKTKIDEFQNRPRSERE